MMFFELILVVCVGSTIGNVHFRSYVQFVFGVRVSKSYLLQSVLQILFGEISERRIIL